MNHMQLILITAIILTFLIIIDFKIVTIKKVKNIKRNFLLKDKNRIIYYIILPKKVNLTDKKLYNFFIQRKLIFNNNTKNFEFFTPDKDILFYISVDKKIQKKNLEEGYKILFCELNKKILYFYDIEECLEYFNFFIKKINLSLNGILLDKNKKEINKKTKNNYRKIAKKINSKLFK